MGKAQSIPVQYGNFVGEQQPGESRELVSARLETMNTKSPERSTMLDAFLTTVKNHGAEPFLATRVKLPDGKFGRYIWKSYDTIRGQVEPLARAMKSRGLAKTLEYEGKPLKTLGIYSKNREEWLMTDIACWYNTITNVPLYDTLGEESIAWIFEQTEMSTVFAALQGVHKLIAMRQRGLLPTLKTLVSFDEVDPDTLQAAKTLGLEVMRFQSLIDEGMKLDTPFHPCKPDDLITICYTSGTTAKCKGVEITQRAFFDNAFGSVKSDALRPIHVGKSFFSYLPLAHVFERVLCYIVIENGLKTSFFQGEITKIGEDIALAGPEVLVGVPRVFSKFYDNIMSGINKLTGFKRHLIDRAIASKTATYRATGEYKHWFYDALALRKIRQAMGGNIDLIICAAAPAQPMMMETLKLLLSCKFFQAFGQTESAGAITLCDPLDLTRGSLGPPMPACSIKVVDVPEMNYFSHDVVDGVPVPRGELCIKGTIVSKRYFKDPEKTKEAIDTAGWMHTGDIGCLLPNGTVKIIDRKKNIFKLQQGEYVAPERIENLLVSTKWVLQAFVYGDSTESYLVAVIIPKMEQVMEWAQARNLNSTYEQLCADPSLCKEVYDDITRECKKGKLMGYEFVKKIHMSATPFSVESGSLTPTMKIKRNEAKKIYAEAIAHMYADPVAGPEAKIEADK